MSKISITGAAGFVGVNLENYLKTSQDVESMRVRYLHNR